MRGEVESMWIRNITKDNSCIVENWEDVMGFKK